MLDDRVGEQTRRRRAKVGGRWVVRLSLSLMALSVPARAAELRVLAAGAVRDVVRELADEHTKATGVKVDVSFGAMGRLKARIGTRERVDVVILTPLVFEELIESGKFGVTRRAAVGRVGVGVAVRKGVVRPDIATTESFRSALLSAPALLYGDPEATSSGAYFAKVIDKLGLSEAVRAKTMTFADGHEVMTHLGRTAGAAIGVTQISEILANLATGGEFVGPLPPELQNYTVYEAAVSSNAPSPIEADAFFDRLVDKSARARFGAMGFEEAVR
jgi:molybdate transport system substrate-binding protein